MDEAFVNHEALHMLSSAFHALSTRNANMLVLL